MSTLSAASVSKYAVTGDTRQESEKSFSTEMSSDFNDTSSNAQVDTTEYIYVDATRFKYSVARVGKGAGSAKAVIPPSASERERALECAKALNEEFIYVRRVSARPAIVVTLVILSLMCLYHMIYYHMALRERDGSRPADGMYGYDMAGRIVAIICGIALAFLAATESWAENTLGTQISFLFFVLILSLSWAFG